MAEGSEARLALAVYESVGEGIIALEPDGTLVMANREALRLFGYAPGEVKGLSVGALVPAMQGGAADLQRFCQGSDGSLAECWVILDGQRKDGTRFPLELRMSETPWEGRVLFSATLRDVTERTRELRDRQSQLARSEKLAALGQLVAGVAHEINTPLGALSSNNDLFIRSIARLRGILGRPDVPAEAREHPEIQRLLDAIDRLNAINKTAAARIVGIVTSLRRFARLDAAEIGRVQLHEGLESTLTLVHHELRGRIEVVRHYGELPLVECYPNQLNQVFMNLLVNAAQAIEGCGRITIGTRALGDHVVVEIEDTGKGIPPDRLARIFDPGYTTKGSGVGTGLGLSIVHQIVEDHGGRIEVESEVGTGTAFRLVLPVWLGERHSNGCDAAPGDGDDR